MQSTKIVYICLFITLVAFIGLIDAQTQGPLGPLAGTLPNNGSVPMRKGGLLGGAIIPGLI